VSNTNYLFENFFQINNNSTTKTNNNNNCKKYNDLTNKISSSCQSSDECCIVNIYENTFYNELQNCNKITNQTICNNNKLQTCKKSCNQKSTDKCKNNKILTSCYQTCFTKEYACSQSPYNYEPNIVEIIIVVCFVFLFICCLLFYSLECYDCHINMDNSYSHNDSKVHVDNTEEIKDENNNSNV
jgi:hypothetical protein